MSRDVRGFLHVCCRGAYREVTWQIVHAILEAGLYDRSVAIELGVLGDKAEQHVVETLIRPFERFRIGFRSSDIGEYEFPTLGLLQDACQTWTGPVYYLHTKGVTQSPDDQYARYWRQLMLDEVVINHERCLAELMGADAVGTNWRGNHYSGNFWWARASHIRRLPDIRGLQRFPRPISADPVWNKRLQCEFWLTTTHGRFADVGYSGLDLYKELRWTTSVADIINELLIAGGGHHFVELSMDGPSQYFGAVVANSKTRVSYRSDTDACPEEDFLAADPPDGGYDVIFVDTWHETKHSLDVIERCLPKLSTDGVMVVHDTNPPSAWHQRPADEFEPGWDWNGQVWRAVVEFRIRHPQYEVFTVDTDWGCTVIRPGRRACQEPGAASADQLDWAAFERERSRLLNLVNVGWFRRHLYADPYLTGRASLVTRTQVLNFLISVHGLDSYLEIGTGAGENLAQIIAPIRQSVDPYADATYQMTSDDFFACGLGLDRYDVIFVDGLHEEDQCRRDLENALARLSDRGWIVAHDANPPTEWHQRPVEQFEPGSDWNGTVWKALIRFRSEHPELELCTLDVDWGCALLRRRTGTLRPNPTPALPDTLDWVFFAEHRCELLNLVPASTEELRNLLDRAAAALPAAMMTARSQRPRRDVAVLTCVADESFFFPIWLRYYSRFVEPENLYVLDHDSADGSTDGEGFVRIPIHNPVSDWAWLVSIVQAEQHRLLERYGAVLYTDVDEIVVPDPAYGTLGRYLDEFDDEFVNCRGWEVVHDPQTEPPLDPAAPILAQRRWWFRNTAYDKPLLARVPMSWGVGFHSRIDGAVNADPRLFLVHLHRVDYERCLRRHRQRVARPWQPNQVAQGWGYHTRIIEPDAFARWFFTDASGSGGSVQRQPIPPRWRHAF